MNGTRFVQACVYGVVKTDKATGRKYLMRGGLAGAALFRLRKDAEQFRRGLSEAGVPGGKVVKLKITHEVLA